MYLWTVCDCIQDNMYWLCGIFICGLFVIVFRITCTIGVTYVSVAVCDCVQDNMY